MGFLWPSWKAPAPSGATRFGRLLHWAGIAAAIVLAVLGCVLLTGNGLGVFAGALVLACAALVYLFGRGLRYLFSGE